MFLFTVSKKPSAKQDSSSSSISLNCSSVQVRSPLKIEAARSDEKPSYQESASEKGNHAPDVDMCKQERQHGDHDQVSETCSQQMELDEPIPQTNLQQKPQSAAQHNSSFQTSNDPLNAPRNAPPTTSQERSLSISTKSFQNLSSPTSQNFSPYTSQEGQRVHQTVPQQVSRSSLNVSQKMPLPIPQNSSLETYQKPPQQRSEENIPGGGKSHIEDKQSNLKSEPLDASKAIPFSSSPVCSTECQTDAQSTTVDHGDRTHCEPQNHKVSGGHLESQDMSNSNMIRSAPDNGRLEQSVKEKSVKVQGPPLGVFQVGGATHKQVQPPFHHGQESDTTAHYNHSGQTNQLYMQQIGKSALSTNGQPQSQSIPQNINVHPSVARYPPYQHHVSYSYRMAGKPPEGQSNVFPHYQQQHYYQPQGNRSFLSEEWHRTQFSGPDNAYHPASVNGPLKGSSMSPMSSDGTVSSPNPLSNRPRSGPVEAKEAGGPVKPANLDESFDRSESPKEILDLDSHRLAGHGGHTYPQPSANLLYNSQRAQSGMQQDGRAHPLHMMNTAPFPNQNYIRRHYSPQQPNSHLMEALQRPQRLPFQPGQTHMAVSRRPQLVPHFQGRMPLHRGLPPEHFFHPR